jgi:hypothetical protein
VLVSVRQTAGTAPPSAGWIVRGCVVKKPDGTTASLQDSDQFEIEGDPHGKRGGRDVRLHYRGLGGTPDKGLKIHAHYPASGGTELPAGSTIVDSGDLYFESQKELGDAIDDSDQLEVQATVGGTNVHRGHSLGVKGGRVSAGGENINHVHNWSTGCQVFPFFVDFNLFILLCGLSKRWLCLHDAPPPLCPQIETGTATDPNLFVWEHAKITITFPPKDLSKQITDDTTTLQNDRKQAQADVKTKVDAWYKAHKDVRRPTKEADAEQQLVTWYAQRLSELDAQIQADTSAVLATFPFTDARTAADKTLSDTQDQRQAVASEQKGLSDAIARRDDLDDRLVWLAGVQGKRRAGSGTDTYKMTEDRLIALGKELGNDANALGGVPEAKKAAESGKAATGQAIEDMKKPAYERAVKMRRDWMRTCDLAQTCKKGFSYTLIELNESDPDGGIQSVDHLDAELARDDAYPKWNGFEAT